MKRYHVAPVLKLNCKLVGLPFSRGRVVWALFRKDKFTYDVVARFAACVELLQKHPLRLRKIISFMASVERCDAHNKHFEGASGPVSLVVPSTGCAALTAIATGCSTLSLE